MLSSGRRRTGTEETMSNLTNGGKTMEVEVTIVADKPDF